ncbi:hypothetical protein [Winogradskyella forsetii]|uniref:hypothetical protein n=1 Tax=Winogradskyella forsetii TaxID=2686077 RepID=UPI0015BCB31C|nr:hypothetical protein [Winogradskyella forsetii]
MLNVYTYTSFLTPEHRGRVFPLLLDLWYKKDTNIARYYSITDRIKDANIIILPLEYNYIKALQPQLKFKFLQLAQAYSIPLWIYTGGDFGYSFKEKEIYNFRLGGFHSKMNDQTFIMPSFIVDPYQFVLKREFKPNTKSILPKIGFVGHADGGFLKLIKEYVAYLKVNVFGRFIKQQHIDYQSFYPSSIKRAQILNKLNNNENLHSNFIFRSQYRAGIQTESDKAQSTIEFFENMEKSGYIFCLRGVGNFSVRLYETLAMGRIPVLINTDCRLPMDWKIDWLKHIVHIESFKIKDIETNIVDFHKRLSISEFVNLQFENRTLWKKHMNRNAFFIEIYNVFKEQ